MSDENCNRAAAGRHVWLRWTRCAALLAVLGPAAACAPRPPPPASPPAIGAAASVPGKLPRAAHYVPGEIMEFALTYRGIRLGRAVLAVGEPGLVAGNPILIVRSRIESTGLGKLIQIVHDDIRTWIDLSTGEPLKSHADMLFGQERSVQENRFAGRRVAVDHARNGARPIQQSFLMPPGEFAHDPHTVLGAVRAWSSRPGESVTFYGLNGRRIWRGSLRVVRHETIRTAMGLRPAIRFEGTAQRLTSKLLDDPQGQPRTFTMWLSDDANRLPLRIEGTTDQGTIEMEMTRYRRPGRYVRTGAP